MIQLASGTARTLSHDALAPYWVVVPVAVLAMLVVGGHVLLIDRSDQPAARKRIRTVNGLLMMFTVPVIAAGFGFVPPAEARLFLMTWMLGVCLILLVLVLALMDIAASMLIHRRERVELQRQIAEARALAAAAKQAR